MEGDARTRPWQAAAVGFEFAGEGAGANVARRALAGMSAQHADEQYQRYLARQELLPPEWTKVSGSSDYALELTPDELDALVDRVEALVRPYVRTIRNGAPPDSAIVQVTLRAFLNPDVLEDDR